MATTGAVIAVLGGNVEQATAEDQRLQAAQVTHVPFEELTDMVAANSLDLDTDFIQVTLAMANNSDDEEWRSQWDAVQNLRVLNKFYYEAFERVIDQFSGFLKGQVENLRSNNSRNALALFRDIFSQNQDKVPDGRKVTDTWAVFLDSNFAAIFGKVNADKKFLQTEAQRGVLAAAEASPIPQTIAVLIKNSSSKVITLSEFACRALELLIKSAPPALFHEGHHEEQCLQIVHCLCEVLDQRQPKKVKYAKPALQHVQGVVGGAETLKQVALKAYNFMRAQAAGQEEVKEATEAEQAKLVAKVGKIVNSLTAAKKAAPAKGGFRSFMKTAKTELSQMQLGAEGAASAGPGAAGFAMTVALPQGQPLVDLSATQVSGAASATQPEGADAAATGGSQ